VTPENKTRFHALARQEGLSDSALLGLLVDTVLARNQPVLKLQYLSEAGPRRDRLTVRLRPTDGARLRERAKARGMKDATYLAALTRAHVRGNPPLPKAELDALKRAVAEVSAIGRNLNQIARAANEGWGAGQSLDGELRTTLQVLEHLKDEVRALIKVNLISWEVADAEANS
jgi:mobilization protein NikA